MSGTLILLVLFVGANILSTKYTESSVSTKIVSIFSILSQINFYTEVESPKYYRCKHYICKISRH